MNSVNDGMPTHVIALLGAAMDAFRNELAVAERPPALEGLRSSQMRLLSLTPPDGMRVTDLAERVGMTKQALGEFANVLETGGYLESLRDPADGRVRILRPTEQGLRAVEATERVIGEIERRWRERLGPSRWDDLRALLTDVARLADDERKSSPVPPAH